MGLWYEAEGEGPGVVLLHAGVADSRMWEEQRRVLVPRHTVVRCDLRGFGSSGLDAGVFSHAHEVLDVLDRAGLESAVIVGASLGGSVAMEVALLEPDRVNGLLLVAPALPGHTWSTAVVDFGQAEDAALERGDVEAAVELNVRLWLDGAGGRRADVSDATRLLVAEMQRTAIEHVLPHLDDADERPAVADLAARLGEIAAPTEVVVGDQDVGDFVDIAHELTRRLANATLHVIPGAAHLPSLEAPETFNSLLLDFAARHAP
jgi:3-oxoadipate enol-lactonase